MHFKLKELKFWQLDYETSIGRNFTLITFCISCMILAAPQNMMSPSLSNVANDLGFKPDERDLYIGGYMSLCFSVMSLPLSLVTGVFADIYDRQILLSITIFIGGISMILFGITKYYQYLLVLRVISGACLGSLIPMLFSMVGDIYHSNERNTVSAILSASLGGGTLIGQLFVGYSLSYLGWRLPYVMVGILALIISVIFYFILREPKRGCREECLQDAMDKGIILPTISWNSFITTIRVPTISLLIIQALPLSVFWGILSVHLHDLLATESHMTMAHATSFVGLFGIGAAIGSLGGGFAGSILYHKNKIYLPLFMGITCILAACCIHLLLAMDMDSSRYVTMITPLIMISGLLAAVNGANIRGILLNLTAPHIRGVSMSMLHLVVCIGRGVGPTLMNMYMIRRDVGRKDAVDSFVNLWIACGVIVCLASMTLTKDEDKMKVDLKKFAEDYFAREA